MEYLTVADASPLNSGQQSANAIVIDNLSSCHDSKNLLTIFSVLSIFSNANLG